MISSSDILHGKILIVDDQESNVLLLERTLRDVGYVSIASTTDSGAVCELHRKHHYDLILLDLQMPGMDGFQVMEALKEVETDGYLPVLVITAQPEHKLRAFKAGAKDFVSKPFELAEVLARVYNMLEVRLLHEATRNHGKILELMALNDPLTGLANRRLLDDRMTMAIVHARRNNSAMAVVYLDLDGFKQINDTLGHGAGDALLKMVAGRLVATVREEDTVARLGGDEFIIVLWHVSDTDNVDTVVLKVVEAVSQPYDIEGHTVDITTSAGVGIYPVHGEDADTLMKSADLALYEAKHAGKNAYRISERSDLAGVACGQQNLPAVSAPLSDARTKQYAELLATSSADILRGKILIVDDQEASVLLLERILIGAGYVSVTSTTDPTTVCELYRTHRYDLVLLDLHMPVMDGFQVMEALKKVETDGYLPVLVITAQPDHKLHALASGAKDFIAKPFDLTEVQTRIHNMLEVRLLYKELGNYNRILEQTVLERTAELRASEARFHRLTELSSDWYWEQDENGAFTEIFGPVLEMLGIRLDDTLGHTRDDHGASWNESERETLEANLDARQPFLDFVYSRTNAEGLLQYLMVSGEPMFDPSGRFTGYRGIGKDVTASIHPESPQSH